MGDGTTIHASSFASYTVQGTPIYDIPGYVGARRLLGSVPSMNDENGMLG